MLSSSRKKHKRFSNQRAGVGTRPYNITDITEGIYLILYNLLTFYHLKIYNKIKLNRKGKSRKFLMKGDKNENMRQMQCSK